MRADDILRANWLDVLFENRNKAYGAYVLRKSYNTRLLKALAAALSTGILLFLLISLVRGSRKSVAWVYTDHELLQVNPKQPERIPETKPATPPPRKTFAYAPPVFVNHVDPQLQSPDDNEDADVSGVNNPNGQPGGTTTQPDPLPQPQAQPEPQPEKQPEPQPDPNQAFTAAEEMPEYPGGKTRRDAFLQDQLGDYVASEGETKIATVEFIVERDGTLSDIKIISGGDEDYNRRVLRAFQKMPRWKPGKQNGHAVRIWYQLPVRLMPGDE